MVSDATRRMAWNEYLDVERAARYYDKLSRQYRRRHNAVMVGLALCAIAGAGRFMFSDYIGRLAEVIVDLGIIAVSVFGLLGNHARKSASLHAVSVLCFDLQDKHKALWSKIENNVIGNDEAYNTLMDLIEAGERATSIPGWADISVNDKLNRQSQREADDSLVDQYSIKEA
ncbi:MAG: hypothetical protein OXU79_14470 [Gemmatimonadota bacterium]|nr:hypothetical protein [Gemmatimonadota bacterium]